MGKRSREEDGNGGDDNGKNDDVMGASEFACAVNGDDPRAILEYLKRFTRIVRRERKLALSSTNDIQQEDGGNDVEISSDDDNEDDEGPNEGAPSGRDAHKDEGLSSAKRRKKEEDEAWKEDTAAWNVPFVGTSFSKGDSGRVALGEWPTGFLEAYLKKSPVAVELTSDNLIPGHGRIHKHLQRSKKGRKMSLAIQKAYLKAISELITAAIPVHKLRRELLANVDADNSNGTPRDSLSRLTGEIIRKRLPGFLSILDEETGRGKGQATVLGGCGQLASHVLRLLESLSATSTVTARYIARALEQNVSDGVVRTVVCPQRNAQKQQALAGDGGISFTSREEARIAAIRLASVFVEQEDNVILSCITSPGAKDRKIRAGILFLVLKDGINVPISTEGKWERFLLPVSKLFSSLRRILFRNVVPKRCLVDIFSLDCIQNLCRIAAYSPELSASTSFQSVLKSSDTYSELSALGHVGVEARRLLFSLLATLEASPLLLALRGNDKSAKKCKLVLVRALSLLFDTSRNVEIQQFLIHCVLVTPELMPAILQALALPFPDFKRSFRFMKRLNFMGRLLQYGPPVTACVPMFKTSSSIENALPSIFPPELKRHHFNKALQGSCPLLVVETLKFLLRAFARFQVIYDEVPSSLSFQSLIQILPEVQVILATVSRFNMTNSKAGGIVTHSACELVRNLVSAHPAILEDISFDWSKMMPTSAQVFCSTQPLLQMTVLKCLRQILLAKEGISTSHGRALTALLLDIVMTTRSPIVYKSAREMTVYLIALSSSLETIRTEAQEDIRYEASCWVDGMTKDTITEFCSALQDCHGSSSGKITFLKAWKISGLSRSIPNLNVSALLIHCLERITHSSEAFALLVHQVTALSLLHHFSPLPLAVITSSVLQENESSEINLPMKLLIEYTNSIIKLDSNAYNHFTSLFVALFSPGTQMLGALSSSKNVREDVKLRDLGSTMRQVSHLYTISESRAHKQHYLEWFHMTFPITIKGNNTDGINHSISRMLRRFQSSSQHRDRGLDILLCSSGLSAGSLTRSSIWQFTDELHTLSSFKQGAMSTPKRKALLYLYFVGDFVPEHLLTKWSTVILDAYGMQSIDKTTVLGKLSARYLNRMVGINPRMYSIDFVVSVFANWLSFSPSELDNREDSDILIGYLEHILCRLLSEQDVPGLIACSLYNTLVQQPEEDIIKRCLLTKKRLKGGPCLLTALLHFDTFRYTSAFLSLISSSDAEELLGLAKSGRMDDVLSCALTCGSHYKSPKALFLLSKLFLDRAVLILKDPCSTPEQLRGILSTIQSFDEQRERQLLAHFDKLHLSVKNLVSPTLKRCDEIIELAIYLGGRKTLDTRANRTMSGTVMMFLFSRLPDDVRCHFREDNDKPNDSLHVVDWVLKLLYSQNGTISTPHSLNQNVLEEATRVCIQFGLDSMKRPTEQKALLGLVLELLQKRTSEGLHGIKLMHPNCMLSMITSHPNTTEVLGYHGEESDGIQQKCMVLRILDSCFSTVQGIKFNEAVWEALLCGFCAGTTPIDNLIRRLLLLYSKHASMDTEAVYMENLRWSEVPNNASKPRGWNWLADAIDLRRLQATISNFPIDDKVEIEEGKEIESLACNAAALANAETMMTVLQPKFPVKGLKRYSPGFLLPLILCALEEEEEEEEENYMSHNNIALRQNEPLSVNQRVIQTQLAQRLSEKGCLALALASLCSNCGQSRCIAAAILERYSSIVNSEEARQQASWRERPQISMLLKSVQRALTIRKALEGDCGNTLWKLPGLSAIFLARASLILARPSDSLYQQINRLFLQNEADHGAFQDLSRLPAFVSLFCSSADEPGLARQHRLGAVRLVKDGMTDESSYGALAACHASELLLSGIDYSFITPKDPGGEASLILSTLRKIIITGGQKCQSDLIARLGLLSWLRTFLIAKMPMLEVSSSEGILLSFLGLLLTAVSKAENVLPRDELGNTCAILAGPVLEIWLRAEKTNRAIANESTILDNTVHEIICLLGRNAMDNEMVGQNHPGGVSLRSALDFLTAISDASCKHAALVAFSCLPLRPVVEDISCIERFSNLALRSMLDINEPAKDGAVVLKRVSLIVNLSRTGLDDECNIVLRLLDLRKKFYKSKNSQEQWLEVSRVLALKNPKYPDDVKRVLNGLNSNSH